MFKARCDELNREVLVLASDVSSIENLDGGEIVVHYRCWCGEPGVWVTGRHVQERSGHLARLGV